MDGPGIHILGPSIRIKLVHHGGYGKRWGKNQGPWSIGSYHIVGGIHGRDKLLNRTPYGFRLIP